jgi:hypothetical protein
MKNIQQPLTEKDEGNFISLVNQAIRRAKGRQQQLRHQKEEIRKFPLATKPVN